MHGDDAPGRRSGLAESDIGDSAGATKDGDAPAAAASVGGDGVNNVRAGGDLKNMGLEGVGGVSGDDDWGLGLVLGARRTATWAAAGGRWCA